MSTQICQRKVDNAQIWHAFDKLGVTHYCAAPTVQLGIVGYETAHKLPRPVVANIAGAAPTATLIKKLEAINILVTHVYGLTETCVASTCCRSRTQLRAICSQAGRV